MRGYRPIEDYAILGDGRSAALVARDGSIDWLCLPHFHSPSVFGAILDAALGGRYAVTPRGDYDVERRYLPGTCVLETTFRTPTGVLRLTDCMPVEDDDHREEALLPAHEVLRIMDCTEGAVDVDVVFDPRPDYGRVMPRMRRDRAMDALVCRHGGSTLALQSDIPLHAGRKGAGAMGSVRLRAGQRRTLSLTSEQGPAVVAGVDGDAWDRVDRTIDWWRAWSDRIEYDGPYADAVLRSLLTLKLLSYAPSGAIVAAPTTSLPERIGGAFNWDYRYCWLRDATMTLRALFDVGVIDEGEAFLDWLLQATRLTWPRLQVMYDVFGETDLSERFHRYWEGYRGSRPVRLGNAAYDQLQLDIYGEVITAAVSYVERGGKLDRQEARMIRGLGDTICALWKEPDSGIWEFRGPRQLHTLAQALCWVGLDGLIRLHENGVIKVPVDRYRETRDAIRTSVEERGWNSEIGAYTATLDGDDVDASLLLLPLYGYADARDERVRATGDVIHRELGLDGLIYRFRHQEVDDAGAFGICSFWRADLLARQGRTDEAREVFEHLLATANDVGLLGEEIQPETRSAIGNFPQAFTHVGLVNAATAIARAEGSLTEPTRTPGKEKR